MTKARQLEIKITNQILATLVVILALALGYSVGKQKGWVRSPAHEFSASTASSRTYLSEPIILPKPQLSSLISLETTLQNRRSRRSYTSEPLTLAQISQLAWSLQGQTAAWGGRTAPSAKSAYPLEITLVVKSATDLAPGIYHYQPAAHSLSKLSDAIPADFDPAVIQSAAQTAPVVFIISADFSKTTAAFQGPHDSAVYLEAGHAAQNFCLQSESLHLGTVTLDQFDASLLTSAINLPQTETIIYLLPVGIPSES